LEEQTIAPDFTLKDQKGTAHSLYSYRGKKVLVYFYPQDDTPACSKEACSLRDGFSSLKDQNIEIMGISPDSAVSHQGFIQKYSLPFTLLSDPDHTVMEAWGTWGEKNLYGRITIGVIRRSFLLDETGKILKIFKRVDTARHADQVLAFLNK